MKQFTILKRSASVADQLTTGKKKKLQVVQHKFWHSKFKLLDYECSNDCILRNHFDGT